MDTAYSPRLHEEELSAAANERSRAQASHLAKSESALQH
jgi:hypothetical protein